MNKNKFLVTVELTYEQWLTLLNIADKRGITLFELLGEFADSLGEKKDDDRAD